MPRTPVFLTAPRSSVLATLLLSSACGLFGDDDDDTGDPTQNNLDQYEQLRLALEQKREQILPPVADDLAAAGPYLAWLDRTNAITAVLHTVHYPGGDDVVSEVPIGNAETEPFYVISETIGMTAHVEDPNSIYTVFRLDTGSMLDQITRTKPQAADYDAYGVFGDQAYIVADDEQLEVYEWTPGTDTPTSIGSLGAIAADLGVFIGFVVAEDMAGTRRLVAIGNAATYSVDLATMVPTRLPLPVQVFEGAINEHGIAVIDGTDLWWLEWDAAEARAIHDELAASPYVLNSTFAMAHLVSSGTASQDLAIDGTVLYYRSTTGVYGYDVASHAVTPVLLDNRTYDGGGVFVTYTSLNYSDAGLFAVGLESTNGATGVDGPVYRIQL